MCIVVDINTLAPVFSENCRRHQDFLDIKKWINAGKGFLVYGGTKYKNELGKTRYLRLIRLMKDAGRAVPIRDDVVDSMEATLLTKTKGMKCDDQHIIALLGASWCPLLCSADLRSFDYIKDRSLFPSGMPQVRIYTSARNADLLKRMSRNMLKNLA